GRGLVSRAARQGRPDLVADLPDPAAAQVHVHGHGRRAGGGAEETGGGAGSRGPVPEESELGRFFVPRAVPAGSQDAPDARPRVGAEREAASERDGERRGPLGGEVEGCRPRDARGGGRGAGTPGK